MKQFDRRPTIEQARAEFEAIAQEMNLPIENLESGLKEVNIIMTK